MWHEDRYRHIRGLLKVYGHVSVERIVAELNVSRETVRRDLVELEALGDVRRVHGGAVLTDSEPPLDVRAETRVREKRAIARKVASLVENGQTLFLDAGSTTSLIAEALTSLVELTVITNSVEVARKLSGSADSESRNHVQLLGGQFGAAVGLTYGAACVAEIARYQPDIAILSPVGVDAGYGATSYLAEEADVARAMATHAKQTFIAADFAKIGIRSRIGYAPLAGIGVLITNKRATKHAAMPAITRAVGRVEYV
jgi:DeoR family fructose operon transcriptional repressor